MNFHVDIIWIFEVYLINELNPIFNKLSKGDMDTEHIFLITRKKIGVHIQKKILRKRQREKEDSEKER